MNKRISWESYFMRIADIVAIRSTCDRAHVGCVIAHPDHHILSTGYNGSVSGAPHCDDVGHIIVNGHCVRTVHAEMNAIAQAAKIGSPTKDCTLYTTHFPCLACVKVIINAGISRIVYREEYSPDPIAIAILSDTNIEVIKLCD